MIALLILQAVAPVVPPPAATPPAEVVQVPAGRVDENAVRQAEDAFGSTIGRETIGIYSAGSVRGFSPIAAGNARIDGLYFDLIAAPVTRIRRSSSIKVGLSAQGYLFPAPTGVVDYALRLPDATPLVSTTLSGNSWGGAAIEVDAEVPLAGDRLSLGLGGSLNFNQFANGSNSRQHVLGSVLPWQPATDIRIVGFYGRSYIDDDEIGPLLSTAGPYLPPRIERRRFFGAQWMDYSGYAETGGAIASIALAPGWTAQLGGFYSATGAHEDIFPFLDEVQPNGSARYIAFSDPPFRRAAISGEARVTYAVAEGPRRHLFAGSVRARSRRDRIGGSAFLEFGPVRLGDPLDFAEPPITYGAQARDAVEQWTGGVAYIGRWAGVGEISAGLSRTDYRKRFRRPDRPVLATADRPWLWNVAAAAYLSDRLALYGGYTRGLEETGLPPQNATNRNQALPAILTSQRDAGLRWRIGGDVKLVAGVFDVRKPYLSLDAANLFTTLGATRHRGIEASVSGTLLNGLSVALGGVLLDPVVTGEARTLGRAGKRPVGIATRSVDLNLDWRVPGGEPLSVDLNLSEQGRVASTVDNSLFIPSRATLDLGARYRFRIAGNKSLLRVSVSNMFDTYAWDYAGPGTFDYIAGRFLSAYLSVDI